MANIVPIIAVQDTPQSTSSTTMVDANCETSVLANGVDYLVIVCGNHGGSDTSCVSAAQILFGSTVIGYSASEGRGTALHADSTQLNGFKKVTGNGTDTLKIQFQCITSSDTAYIGAMAIIAIPLDDLTLNTDYWFTGSNSSGWEQEDPSSWTTLKTMSPTLPADDYLILMSAEASSPTTTASDGYNIRGIADGSYICETEGSGYGWTEEPEDTNDVFNISWLTMETLSAGSRTFTIECNNIGSAVCDFRRSNIWVFKKSSFAQILQNKFSTSINTSSSTYVDWTASDLAINPTVQSYILALGYAVGMDSSFYSPLIELYNATETAEHRIDGGEYVNEYGTGGADRVATMLAHCGQYNTGSDTWRFRVRSPGGTVYWGRNNPNTADIQSNLILWQLSTVEAAAPKQEQLFFGRVM